MMYRTRLLLVCLLLLVGILHAQNETRNWFFGNNAGLSFASGSPVAVLTGVLTGIEGAASASDASGNLLFYTNGLTVYNRNHLVMTNGSGLMGGGSSVQSSLIVPLPGSATLYYLFTTNDNSATGLRYSIIDMSLSAGLGAVTATKNVLLVQPTAEMLTAVKHSNCIDNWIVTHSSTGNNFHAFRLTSGGVGPIITSAAGASLGATIGALRISPNGTKIAYCAHDGVAQLFDFNSTTGQVTNPVLLNAVTGLGYGTEFSPNSNVLYCGRGNNYKDIYQYNVAAGSSAAILASQVHIANSAASWGGCLQLGPDGKIYFSSYNTSTVGCINSPNTLGVGCNYVDNQVNLGGRTTTLNLPNFVTSYFANPNPCVILPSAGIPLSAMVTSDQDVLLRWQLNEVDPEHLFVERSSDGITYQLISTDLPNALEYLDDQPGALENFYRLMWYDANGGRHYTEVVTAHFRPSEPTLVVYPVPTTRNGSLNIQYYSPMNDNITCRIIDAQGREIYQRPLSVQIGTQEFVVPTESLATGIYYMVVGRVVKKVVIE
jgi:WD40 repeat protein